MKRSISGILVCAALLTACQPDTQPELEFAALEPPRNLILLTIDTLRTSHLGVHGYSRDTTPNLDALAAKSVRFEHAYSHAANTPPAFSTIMTSRYPHQHGVIKPYRMALPDEEITMAERFAEAGFNTAAILGIGTLVEDRNLHQGFKTYECSRYTNEQFWWSAETVTDKALAWLRSNHGSPFFLWVHYFEPHLPHDTTPQRFRNKFSLQPSNSRLLTSPVFKQQRAQFESWIDRYDEAVAYVDSQAGRLLEELENLGLIDASMIVMTADHGEGLGERGYHGHTVAVFEELVHVPLMIHRPGIAASSVEKLVRHIDILPTVLHQFELPADESMQGVVLPLGAGSDAYPDLIAYSETHTDDADKASRSDGRWKLMIEAPKVGPYNISLFDLASDPGELDDLVAIYPEKAKSMAQDLRAWMTGTSGRAIEQDVKPKELEMLKSLGYAE